MTDERECNNVDVSTPPLPFEDRWSVCLAAANRNELDLLVQRIEDMYQVRDVKPVAAGLGMLSVQDSVREEAFHLGEFSLATASIELTRADGSVACGGAVLMCEDQSLVRGIALLDAVLREHWEGASEAAELLQAGQRVLDQVEQTRQQIMRRTAVDFSTLDQDE